MASNVQQRFGFMPNPQFSNFHNACLLYEKNQSNPVLPSMPSNMAFHDLTENKIAPPEAKSLLGLGSKFVVTPETTTGSLEKKFNQIQRDFYLSVYLASGNDDLTSESDSSSSVKRSKLYVKSKWTPTDRACQS